MKTQFRAIVFDPQHKKLSVVLKDVPVLKPDEVLVQVWGSPINPSDRLFCQGLYGTAASAKITPGFEGTGSVVASGSSFWARRLLGKSVSGAVQGENGFWAEYVVLPAQQCLELDPEVPRETAACAFVNPLTALALMEPLSRKESTALIQTAAASQLGRMIQRMAQNMGIPCVHIVHRAELQKELVAQGWNQVLDSSHPQFEQELKELAHTLRARYAIDAVAGSMTGTLIRNLPDHSQVVVYGVLSGQACAVDPGDLIFRDMQVKGFWLSHWIKEKNVLQLPFLFMKLKKFLKAEGQTHVVQRLSLEQTLQEVTQPKGNASAGKILVLPAQ